MSESFEAGWRRRFERFAQSHDDDAGIAGWSESGLRARLRNFSAHWRPIGTGAWIDVGCGAGNYARHMAAQGTAVQAIDYSLPTLRKARQRTPGVSAWVLADAARLPLADARADGALCFGVLQALSSPQAALAELARCVRPGGEVWVDALNARFLPNRARNDRNAKLRFDDPDVLQQAMRDAGFEPVATYWVLIMPARLRWLQSFAESALLRTALNALPGCAQWVCHAYVLRAIRPGVRA